MKPTVGDKTLRDAMEGADSDRTSVIRRLCLSEREHVRLGAGPKKCDL